MLRPLILLLLFLGGAFLVYRFVRRSLGRPTTARARRLDAGELRDLARQARGASSVERALELRGRIQEALEGREDRARLADRVDGAIRQIAGQERLRARIEEAIRSSSLGADLDESEPVAAFEERQIMLARLSDQARSLEKTSERALLELSNLHLALLDLSASEAVFERGALAEALGELESASDSARQRARAEAEVERFLAAREP